MPKATPNKVYVIKIGCNVINNKPTLEQFLSQFAAITEPKILVHGGGKLADVLSAKLGISPKMHEGRRITDEATLDVVTMVYAGLINKQIIARLQALNCNALGLSGADGNIILSQKRPATNVDYGFAGDIVKVNVTWIQQLLNSCITPVLAPITHNAAGQLLNTNADTIAAEVAKALSKKYRVELCFCFDKPGVLLDVNDANTVVHLLNEEKFLQLKRAGSIADGMLPKLTNTFATLHAGVQQVHIFQAQDLPLIIEGKRAGTLCQL
jgi:acetylglutamate kinase